MELLKLNPDDLRGKRFCFKPLDELLGVTAGDVEGGGRIEIYELPVKDPPGQYTAGADFAYGIAGKDYDTCSVFLLGTHPARQVAEVQGRWGVSFDKVLYPLLRLYNDAYLFGEAQVGLFHLRRLYDEYQYAWMHGERDLASPTKRLLKKLGHWKGRGDLVLPTFRRGVREGDVLIRSRATLDQMGKLQFRAKASLDPAAVTDEDLQVKLAGGGSPDLVMAAAYGYFALAEVPVEEKPREDFKKGTMGEILGHNDPGVFYPPGMDDRRGRGRRDRRDD